MSQKYTNNNEKIDLKYRLTFAQNKGAPKHMQFRSQERCDQVHGMLDPVEEVIPPFKARNMPHSRTFELKKPVIKNTCPQPFKLNTTTRAQVRKEYEKKAMEYREEFLRKREEERKQRLKTPNFNLNF